MALDFPASPTVNQTYTAPNGVIWVWDGNKWANGTVASAYAPILSPVFTGDPQAPTPSPGDSDTSVSTTAFVQAAVATANHNTGRNLIHNPLMAVAQRGTGAWTTNNYTVDRWNFTTSLDASSVSRVALADADRAAIGDEAAIFALQNVFTGNAGAASYSFSTQAIEGVRRLSGKTVIVSFWAKAASGTPKLGANILQAFGSGGSPSAAAWIGVGQSATLSTTWTRYSLTFAIPSAVGKTLGTNGDDSNQLSLWWSSGANQNANAGNIGVQSGTIQLWGVQLEIGSVATPLEKPDPRYDLANCQRFYERFGVNVIGYAAAGSPTGQMVTLPGPSMRATPAITQVVAPTLTNCSAYTIDQISQSGFRHYVTVTATGSAFADGAILQASADL